MLLKVENEAINKQVEMIKADLAEKANQKLNANVATESEKQDTKTKQKYLTPPIKPSQCSYYFDNNLMLARSCNILAEDLILANKINIKVKDDEEGVESENEYLEDIINSVEQSQVEIAYMAADYSGNVAGCCKITTFEDNNEFRLTQLPMETLQIMKVNDAKLQETPIYLVEQDTGSGDKKLYKILGETYPEPYEKYNNIELGIVWWKGGDHFYNFFHKPEWLQCVESMNAQISLKSLDTDKINNGFNMNNVLFFNKKPSTFNPNFLNPENNNVNDEGSENNAYFNQLSQNVNAQKIANELKAAGNGTAVLYEETGHAMTMQNVSLSDTNYNYLLEKSKQADQEIISAFGIPRERYMINDIKESMNSQKTAAFWEIYTKSLNAKQKPYELGILEVIEYCYPNLDFELEIDIEVPMFSQIINGKIDVYKDLFMKGILKLGQTIKLLSQYITDLNLEDIDWNDPIYEMYFVNGNPIDDYSLDGREEAVYDNFNDLFESD